jgi:hypothetical protein
MPCYESDRQLRAFSFDMPKFKRAPKLNLTFVRVGRTLFANSHKLSTTHNSYVLSLHVLRA